MLKIAGPWKRTGSQAYTYVRHQMGNSNFDFSGIMVRNSFGWMGAAVPFVTVKRTKTAEETAHAIDTALVSAGYYLLE